MGGLWILAASFALATTGALIKGATLSHGLWQILFCRCLFGTLFIAPGLWRNRRDIVRPKRPALHVFRAVCMVVIILCGTYGFAHLALPVATALLFSRPFFVIVLSAMFLGERPSLVRWGMTALGMAGVLTLTRPFSADFHIASVVVLCGAVLTAANTILLKIVLRSDDMPISMTLANVLPLAMAMGPALFFWTTPDTTGWLLLIGLGIFGVAGQFMTFRGYQISEASFLAPFDYSQIVFASLINWVIFVAPMDAWSMAGILIISVAGLLTSSEERILKATGRGRSD